MDNSNSGDAVKEERSSCSGSKIRGKSWSNFVKTKEISIETDILCSCGDFALKIWSNWSNSLASHSWGGSFLKIWDTKSNFLASSSLGDLFIIRGKGSECLTVKS